jgi:hypothetical protein
MTTSSLRGLIGGFSGKVEGLARTKLFIKNNMTIRAGEEEKSPVRAD